MPDAANAHDAYSALDRAVNDTACDLHYIREMADLLYDRASEDLGVQGIEALARSIGLLVDNIQAELQSHLQQARGKETDHA